MKKKSSRSARIAAALTLAALVGCPLPRDGRGDWEHGPLKTGWETDGTGASRLYTTDPASRGQTFMRWEAAYFDVLESCEVKVEQVSGSADVPFGMLFCVQDADNYYAVLINAAGRYTIEQTTGGYRNTWAWATSIHLATGPGSTNVLRVEFEPFDRSFTVLINGVPVTTIADPAFMGGYSGFIARVPESANPLRDPVEIRFAAPGVSPLDGVWLGDYVIRDIASLERIRGYSAVTGTLSVSGTQLESLAGLESLERVGGDVTISYNQRLLDIEGLSGLRHVGWGLRIAENGALRSLSGLRGIESIGDFFRITGNPTLDALDGPASLLRVGGDIRIAGNAALTRISGFGGLADFDRRIDIVDNASLASFAGFGDVTGLTALSVVGVESLSTFAACPNLRTAGSIWIGGTALTSVALPALTNVSDTLSLRGSASVAEFDMRALVAARDLTIGEHLSLRLNSLREVTGTLLMRGTRGVASVAIPSLELVGQLQIDFNYALAAASFPALQEARSIVYNANDQLTSVSMPSLGVVRGELTLSGNRVALLDAPNLRAVQGRVTITADLADVDGLAGLETVGGDFWLTIKRAASLQGLGRLASVSGTLAIVANPSLTTIGLRNLNTVGGELKLSGNSALRNLDGLECLTTAAGIVITDCPVESIAALRGLSSASYVSLASLPALTSLHGLEGLHSLADGVGIASCGALADLSGLSGLTDLRYDLHVERCPALSNLQGLSSLRSVRSVTIDLNAGLTSLDGLQALVRVSGDLRVEHNQRLIGIAALDGLPGSAFLGDLSIQGNEVLPTSAAVALRDRLRAEGWTGDAAITGNGPD